MPKRMWIQMEYRTGYSYASHLECRSVATNISGLNSYNFPFSPRTDKQVRHHPPGPKPMRLHETLHGEDFSKVKLFHKVKP